MLRIPGRWCLPLGLAAAWAAAGGHPASAHPGDEGRVPVVSRISPAKEGVSVRVVPGSVGRLELSTRGRRTAAVLGAGGQAVLRVGPRGVEANRSAPEWYEFNEPVGIARVPPGASPQARASWVRVSEGRSWRWFDHRLHPGSASAVDRWTVPLRVDGQDVTVEGRFEAAPARPALELGPVRDLPGVDVAVIDQPTLTLRISATGDEVVDVLGAEGEPFASIGPDGVTANARSPIWAPTAQYRNRDLLGVVLDADAEPQTVEVSPAPQLVWPDPRLEPRRPVAGPPGTVLARWSVPVVLRRSGRRATITGRTVVAAAASPGQPPAAAAPTPATDDGGSSTGLIAVVVVLSLAALAALGLLARRRTS